MTWCLVAAALAVAAVPASAQTTDTATATTSFIVDTQARLSVSLSSISFPNADPDSVPSISPTQGAMTITVKGRTAGTLILTVQASDVFRSSMDTIAINRLTWTATGTGFVSGTMSSTVAQTVGSWTSGNFSGTQSYALTNSWAYAVGSYTTTLSYTLTAP